LSDQFRALPHQPNLRHLKIEAKRRLASGEFPTLNAAQLKIAREHGFASWAKLKESVEPDTAVGHVRWVVTRFRDAGTPGWTAPGEDELQAHFHEHYLDLVHVSTLVETLEKVAPQLHEDLVVSHASRHEVRAQIADLRVEAVTESDPRSRLTTLRMYPVAQRVTDERTATPSTRTTGTVPDSAVEVLEDGFAELGLPGLVVAGATTGSPPWSAARGWADLDRPEPVRTDHRFPVYGVTKLVTSCVVLRLVADGRVELDEPANATLRTVRLGNDEVTVRELLTHTSGVRSPAEQFADEVPDAATLLGSTVECDDRRGTLAPSNGAYAVLGQIVADVTGSSYAEAVTGLVLEPLRMSDSWFPVRWPETNAVTGYHLGDGGSYDRAPAHVCTMPAAGGLWSTATDLLRFGLGWSSLLPDRLAREALRPRVTQDAAGADVGLGWLIRQGKDLCGHSGAGPGGGASLLVRLGTGSTTVVCTNRQVPVEPINARLSRPTG
jgi:CubicO group peptidase (beta-lactamase class C family)